MDESKSSPLDGIIEETAAKPQAAIPTTEPAAAPRDNAASNGRATVQDDTVRKLREYPPSAVRDGDIAVLARKVQTLEAMILALRAAVGAAALAGVVAILQVRKLQKRVGVLEGGKPAKVVEIEVAKPAEAPAMVD